VVLEFPKYSTRCSDSYLENWRIGKSQRGREECSHSLRLKNKQIKQIMPDVQLFINNKKINVKTFKEVFCGR